MQLTWLTSKCLEGKTNHRDCTHALNLAQNSSKPYKMSLMSHVQENLEIARKDDRYQGRGDVSSVYGVERERAGLELMNSSAKQKNA